jgi:coenzyme F420-reducing hydrogenase delta subunit
VSDFEPRIIAFCCQHCAYAAADLAGGARLSYPDSLRIVQLPCTGRADVLHILKSFEEGADGVLVAGCMINISAAMGARFAELATEFGERIRELGPNRLVAPAPPPSTEPTEPHEATP